MELCTFFVFFFNRLCFWPAQLSLSILRRKVFTECRCQRHVKTPTWRTSDFRTFQLSPQGVPSVWRRKRTPAAEVGTMGEKFPRILPKVATSTSLLCSFTCPNLRPTAPKKGRWGFCRPKKIRRLRPGLNPRTWVPKASTLTSRPPEPLTMHIVGITLSQAT